MKKIFLIGLTTVCLVACKQRIAENEIYRQPILTTFEDYPVYQGEDLGVAYHQQETIIKLWSPAVQAVKVKLYRTSTGDDFISEHQATWDEEGVWKMVLPGDHKNEYYTVKIKIKNAWNQEQVDPYARAVGVNGQRGQIIDLKDTYPQDWENDTRPKLAHLTDAILYEVHVRDLSIHPSAGIQHKGKYLGFTEENTKNSDSLSTGIDHIADLGVTHVHILPAFDHRSIDESRLDSAQFNWGYDPQNYNVPEGSYATQAENAAIRIKEFKQMVQALHKKGLRIVMDVVYNHTGLTKDSNFDQLVPGYYYRQREDGSYSDASACGNELASEREMVRKFIISSVVYWVNEYHVDGFRFDLMGIHDIETMNQLAQALYEIDPTLLVYGEGWTAGESPLPEKERALKVHAKQMKHLAVFSDDIRDAIKGNVFDEKSLGFVSGDATVKEVIKIGVVAAGAHPQLDYTKGYYAKEYYTNTPSQVINYVSCHDNNTLYDKLKIARPDASEADLIKMHKLANTIVLTSQGIPFLHAGVEMKRTKKGEHNSYNLPDKINQIDWNWKTQNIALFTYYQALIKFRKNHPAFRMTTQKDIQQHLTFIPNEDPQLVTYTLNDHANGDEWENILVAYNGAATPKMITLPQSDKAWNVALDQYEFTDRGQKLAKTQFTIAPISAVILYQ